MIADISVPYAKTRISQIDSNGFRRVCRYDSKDMNRILVIYLIEAGGSTEYPKKVRIPTLLKGTHVEIIDLILGHHG